MGGHIGLLITSALQILCPNFIKENRLHWLFAPVYKVNTGTKNYYYYDEEEFKNHPKGKITKFKGLGQMSSEDLKQSMFSNENKRLETINFSDEGVDLLYDLMGEDTELKKEFVQKNINFKEIPIE